MTCRMGMTVLLVMAAGPLPASADFARLLRNSPFGPSTPSPAVAPAKDHGSLELRGVLKENDELLFSIHDRSTHSSRWVGLKESGPPYIVERYDSRTGQAVIAHRGKLYTLALASS